MKLSIITINLNNRDGLIKTAESVLSQSFRDFEWILIDGCSIDGSKELIEQYADHFSYWVSEPDRGIYNAMNKGILHAKGEYINFMNSGDIFATHDALKKVFSKPRTADILYGYMMVGSINGNVGNINVMKPLVSKYDMFFDTFGHQSTFTKKSLFDRCGLFDETYKIAADHKFFANAIANCNATTEFIPRKLSIYEGGGVSGDYNIVYKDVMRMRNDIYRDMMLEDKYGTLTELREIYSFSWAIWLYKFLVRLSCWCRRKLYFDKLRLYAKNFHNSPRF